MTHETNKENKMSKTTVFRARDSSWQEPLSRMEVERATENTVWVNGRKKARKTERVFIADHFETAQQWLEAHLTLQINHHLEKFNELVKRRDAVKNMSADEIPTDNERH